MAKAGFIKRRLKAEEVERAAIAAAKRTAKRPKPQQQIMTSFNPVTGEFIEVDLNLKRFARKKPIGGEPILWDGKKNIENALRLKNERIISKRNKQASEQWLIPMSEAIK